MTSILYFVFKMRYSPDTPLHCFHVAVMGIPKTLLDKHGLDGITEQIFDSISDGDRMYEIFDILARALCEKHPKFKDGTMTGMNGFCPDSYKLVGSLDEIKSDSILYWNFKYYEDLFEESEESEDTKDKETEDKE